MIISLRHKFAFISVPKTGGTSIHDALRPHADIILDGHGITKHANYRQFLKFMAEWDDMDVSRADLVAFAVIRNPRDWVESWWRYYLGEWFLEQHANEPDVGWATIDTPFDAYVEEVLSGSPARYANIYNQFDMLRDEDGQLGVDTLLPYDYIRALPHVLETMGLPGVELRRLNPSPIADAAPLPDDLAARLESHFDTDLALYRHALQSTTDSLADLCRVESPVEAHAATPDVQPEEPHADAPPEPLAT